MLELNQRRDLYSKIVFDYQDQISYLEALTEALMKLRNNLYKKFQDKFQKEVEELKLVQKLNQTKLENSQNTFLKEEFDRDVERKNSS